MIGRPMTHTEAVGYASMARREAARLRGLADTATTPAGRSRFLRQADAHDRLAAAYESLAPRTARRLYGDRGSASPLLLAGLPLVVLVVWLAASLLGSVAGVVAGVQ